MWDYVVIGSGPASYTIANELSSLSSNVLVIAGKKSKLNPIFIGTQPRLPILGYLGLGGGLNVWSKRLKIYDKIDFCNNVIHKRYISYIYKALKYFNLQTKISFFFDRKDMSNLLLKKIFPKNKFISSASLSSSINLDFKKLNKYLFIKDYKKINQDKNKYILLNQNVDHISELLNGFHHIFLENNKYQIKAKKVILNAGFFNSPSILKRSIDNYPNLISKKARNNIGLKISDHLMGTVFRIRNKSNYFSFKKISLFNKSGIGYSFKINDKKYLNTNNTCFYFVPAFTKNLNIKSENLKKIIFGLQSNFFIIFKLINRIPSLLEFLFFYLNYRLLKKRSTKVVDIWAILNQKRGKPNKLIYDKKNKSYKIKTMINKYDLSNIKYLHSYFKKHLSEDFEISDIDYHFLKNTLSSSAHFTGSLIQDDIDNCGIVDKNFKIYGNNQIFCSDASVISFNGNANITLSVIINSLILADHLKKIK